VSTDKDDQANSLENQIVYYSEFVKRFDNWTLGDVYYDEGITGTSIKKRDGFNRMIQDAVSGKIKLIITKEVSRFARNTVDALKYTRKLNEYGVGVYFVNDNINTLDSEGELRLTLMAALAQEESRKTSERVKWGQKRQMEKGVVFGRDMLGYRVKNGKLFLQADEAEVVKLIFHKYLNEGKGTFIIAKELLSCGIKPVRSREWSNTMILKILRNEKYVGDLLQKKTFTPDYLTHAKKYNRGQEEQVYIKDHHEPIIDRDTWDKTQAELARRSPTEEQKVKYFNRYWSSGKVDCGECGQRFISCPRNYKSGERYRAWRCHAAANKGVKKIDDFGNMVGCDSKSINDRSLATCVQYAIKFIQNNKDELVKEMLDELAIVSANTEPIDTTALTAKLSDLQAKKRRAIDLVLEGIISKEELKEQTQHYDLEMSDLTKRLAEIQNVNLLQENQVVNLQSYVSEIENIMGFGCENMELYRELVDKITIYKDNILDVKLKCIPCALKIQYHTEGRKGNFKTIIDSIEIAK